MVLLERALGSETNDDSAYIQLFKEMKSIEKHFGWPSPHIYLSTERGGQTKRDTRIQKGERLHHGFYKMPQENLLSK